MEIVFNDVSYLEEIKNVSFEIKASKITGIAGGGNSFKDTLFDVLCGRTVPTGGAVIYGSDFRRYGLVCKSSFEQFFYDNVYDEFLFVLKMNNISNPQKRIMDSLRMMHLDDSILNKNYYELSFSEQAMVRMGLAISINPKTLILYEPLFGLDRKDSDIVLKIIRMMRLRYGKTVVIFSKDTDLLYKLCDEVILFNGKVIGTGDKNVIFSDDKLLEKADLRLPVNADFSRFVKLRKKVDIGYRCDFDDLIKDIYRFVR